MRIGGHVDRKERDTQGRERPGHNDIGRYAHHQHDHQGTEVATAQTCQCAVAAVTAERHAIAKGQPAEDRANRVPGQADIGSVFGGDQVEMHGEMGRDHGRANGDPPHAQASFIPAIERILDGAERAESADTRGKAKGDTTQ